MSTSAVSAFLCSILAVSAACAHAATVTVDGLPDEWAGAPAVYEYRHLSGDSGVRPLVVAVQARSDAQHFYLRLTLSREIKLQESNALCLYIDSDSNPATGRSVAGIGAELRWCFGRREGTLYAPDGSSPGTVRWQAVGIRQEPTVSSDDFEFALRRDAALHGAPLLPGPAAVFLLRDEARGNGSWAHTGPLRHVLADTPVVAPEMFPLERSSAGDLRIVTHNTYRDGWSDITRQGAFNRMYRALGADILCLQEVGVQSTGRVARRLEALAGGAWHVVQNADCVVASRWPLGPVHRIGDNLGVLVDLPDDRYATDLYLINCHTPCCDKDEARQAEVDAVIAHVRGLQTGTGGYALPADTPIFILGDMNFVGWRQQLDTMLTGDIQDEAVHGPDRAPDWDGSSITDLFPRHAAGREVYTWRDDAGSYMPGRLDFIFYTDSVIDDARGYVLFTGDLSPDALAAAGLEAADSTVASDHLPVVCDVRLAPVR